MMIDHARSPRLSFLRGLLIAVCAASPSLLAACGQPEAPVSAPTVWMEAKPSPFVDSLKAAVVERPAPDRARIEAHWSNDQLWPGCVIELVLPEGVIAVDGDERYEPYADEASGMTAWLVEFPLGRPLDAVVRYCVETPEGVRSAQCAVRLTGE